MASRFRKVYIVCEDNKILGNLSNTTIYKYRDNAEYACKRAQEKAKETNSQYSNANKPLPKFKVHAFYMVHEDMFRD